MFQWKVILRGFILFKILGQNISKSSISTKPKKYTVEKPDNNLSLLCSSHPHIHVHSIPAYTSIDRKKLIDYLSFYIYYNSNMGFFGKTIAWIQTSGLHIFYLYFLFYHIGSNILPALQRTMERSC